MIAVRLVTEQDREASKEVGLDFRACLYPCASVPAVTNRATSFGAFFMKLIPVSCGRGKPPEFAAVSDEDFAFLNRWKWRLSASGYARRSPHSGHVWMHREVMRRCGFDESLDVDHINNDKLENTRHTLRPATRSQNNANTSGNPKSRCGAKGVRLYRGKFHARISINKVRHDLGSYSTLEEAVAVYQSAAKAAWGDFSRF